MTMILNCTALDGEAQAASRSSQLCSDIDVQQAARRELPLLTWVCFGPDTAAVDRLQIFDQNSHFCHSQSQGVLVLIEDLGRLIDILRDRGEIHIDQHAAEKS